MNKRSKIRLLQIVPYFAPHKGWLETVAEEISKNMSRFWFAEVLTVTFGVGQSKSEYQKDGYTVLSLPAFDVVSGFPFPKFWLPKFWRIVKRMRDFQPDILQTHTRFFLSTFFGWLLSKFWKIPWVHMEHGSGFVVSSHWLIAKVAYFYDKTIGRWSMKSANAIVSISAACADFVNMEFGKNSIVIYRWFDLDTGSWRAREGSGINLVFVWRLVSLKAVDVLIEALYNFRNSNISLTIVWDGEEMTRLMEIVEERWLVDTVRFLWYQNREVIANSILPNADILVNPSLQEWLPTTVIEGLVAKLVVVATDVWWTAEISNGADLILCKPGNVDSLKDMLEYAMANHLSLHGISRDSVVEKFGVEKSMQKLLHVYKDVLGEKMR